jgi:hypothetical protein
VNEDDVARHQAERAKVNDQPFARDDRLRCADLAHALPAPERLEARLRESFR